MIKLRVVIGSENLWIVGYHLGLTGLLITVFHSSVFLLSGESVCVAVCILCVCVCVCVCFSACVSVSFCVLDTGGG